MTKLNLSFKKILLGATAVLPLSACSVGVVADAEKVIQSDRNDADKLNQISQKPLPRKTTGPIKIINDIFLGDKALSRTNGEPLPRTVERDGVTMISSTPTALLDIASQIKSTTGIPVIIESDVYENNDAAPAAGGDDVAGAADATDIPAADEGLDPNPPDTEGTPGPLPGEGNNLASVTLQPSQGVSYTDTMVVNFQGKLSDFLDRVAQRYQINWKYEDGKISFFKREQKTFLVKILSSEANSSMSIESDGSGFGSASQKSDTSMNVNLWDEIVAGVGDILANNGTMTSSKSSGTISINADSSSMRRIESFIAEQNSRFSQQIAVNVEVFNVAIQDSDSYATDFNLVWDGITNLSGGFSSVASGNILDAGQGNWTLLKPDSKFTGTNGVVEALSEKGDISIVTTANATTLNNIPTPIQVGNTRNYVAATSPETDEDGNVVGFSIETDTVTTGFNMQLTPRVMANEIVGLQYNITTSELIGDNDGFDVFTAGDSSVQLPNMNTRAFTQQVMIPNGNTLVLSGFEQVRSSVSKSGVGVADNWLTGGSNSGTMQRDIMVIMITPVIVETDGIIEEI